MLPPVQPCIYYIIYAPRLSLAYCQHTCFLHHIILQYLMYDNVYKEIIKFMHTLSMKYNELTVYSTITSQVYSLQIKFGRIHKMVQYTTNLKTHLYQTLSNQLELTIQNYLKGPILTLTFAYF